MTKTSWPMLAVAALTSVMCGCLGRREPPPPIRIARHYYITAGGQNYDPSCACWARAIHTLYYEDETGKATALTSARRGPFTAPLPDDGGVIYLDQGLGHMKKFPRHGNLMLHTPADGKVLLADEVSAHPDPPVVTDDGIIFSTKDSSKYILRWDLGIENVPEE